MKLLFPTVLFLLCPLGFAWASGTDDLVRALQAQTQQPDSPDTMVEADDAKSQTRRAGVGFYVNETDFVTAQNTLGHCGDAGLRLPDGTPVDVVAQDADAGLAVLTSTRHSAHWLTISDDSISDTGKITVLGVTKDGWKDAEAKGSEVRLLGQIEATGQMIAQIPAKKRNIGAPVLDAQDHVIGLVAGPLTLQGATEAQAKGLRKLAAVVGTAGLPAFLDSADISFREPASGLDATENDPAQALTGVMCR
ncbi:serine protease [Pseudosulfitobacter pseudonitzschiae]|uniref:serine protease n=1 Tax=Pseudosulfitobacter pseudonitzschiae TaxID=1402135 RepID=UPI001D2607EA|nr:serine protease [Pseudosulfitobacter pseudonitzschiae]MBM2020948.1 trypsin-like peptidase domain-containing protein [Pseudosulfitobacter pseudonitzschiae]MBM2035424.1 trypsin-like peptidase domain-containing protein [Pseudosulfitobacter pseudonitzschiae]MBM2049974.1 trypsin-like peptidase domain-containing protein [Pseudosulfitobacter pseudonitzschiae]UFG06349.1 serine protease [Pseudosulfitobacter pseudonitzschiae]